MVPYCPDFNENCGLVRLRPSMAKIEQYVPLLLYQRGLCVFDIATKIRSVLTVMSFE